jgi:predicted DNA repair protein MutK
LASHILPWFSDSFIVAGAVDLTVEAIEKIWQNQDADKLTKERIRNVWEFWHNKP